LKISKKWCLCKYFNNSFIKAYNRDTRTIRMLRTSFFNKGNCITLKSYKELSDFYANNPITKKNQQKHKVGKKK